MFTTEEDEESVSVSAEGQRKLADAHSEAYFSIPGCVGLMQQLLHLLRFGEGLPVVQGGRSSGKTAMSLELERKLQDCSWIARIRCDYDQDIAELLDQITHEFGLQSGPGAGESLAAIRQFSTQLTNNRELAVLILDDVHLLDSQGLGAIVSLLQGNNFPGYGLHMVFFAAPGLVERVDEIGLLDAPVYDFEIPLFSPSELTTFLKKRFPDAPSGLLSASHVQNIWSQSLGSPGVAINMLENEMLEDETDSRAFIKTMPKGHLIALGVLVFVLLWAVFARNIFNGGSDSETGNLETRSGKTTDSGIATNSEMTTVQLPAPAGAGEQGAAEITQPVSTKAPTRQAIEVGRQDTEKMEISPPKLVQPALPGREQSASPNSLTSESGSIQQIPAKPVPQVERKEEKPVVTNASVSAINSQAESAAPKTITPPAKIQNAAERQRLSSPTGLTAQELYLMDQPPPTFTLQIIAASKKDALQQYISEQENRNDLYLYQALREGKVWFVVVTGIFTTRQEAQAAVKELPANQKKAGPWPRELSSVQSEIAANRSR